MSCYHNSLQTMLLISSFISKIILFWRLKVILCLQMSVVLYSLQNRHFSHQWSHFISLSHRHYFHYSSPDEELEAQNGKKTKQNKNTSLRPQLQGGWTGSNPHLTPQSALLPVAPPKSLWQLSLTAGKISHGLSSPLCKNIRDKGSLIPKWFWPMRLPQEEVSRGRLQN